MQFRNWRKYFVLKINILSSREEYSLFEKYPFFLYSRNNLDNIIFCTECLQGWLCFVHACRSSAAKHDFGTSSRKAKSESYIRSRANRAVLSVFVTTTRESLIFRSFHDTSRDSLGSFVTSTARSRCLLSDRMSSAAAGRSGNSRRSAHLSCFHKVCKIYPFDGESRTGTLLRCRNPWIVD